MVTWCSTRRTAEPHSDPGCLSQWWPSLFVVDGIRYVHPAARQGDHAGGDAPVHRGDRFAGLLWHVILAPVSGGDDPDLAFVRQAGAVLLPGPRRPGRPPTWTKRQLIDGIRWRVRAGTPWRDIPDCYGSWAAAYALFRRWQRDGTWAWILTALQAITDAAGRIVWDVSVDSTVARAHQHAAVRVKGDLQAEPPGGVTVERADHALGRSQGGQTTKLHLSCEQRQKPLSIVLTGGQRGDSPQFIAVMEGIRVPRPVGRPRTRPDRALADKAYTSRVNRRYLRRRGIKATIPSKADQDANRRKLGSKGGRPPAFPRRSTNNATPWNAASTDSSATELSSSHGAATRYGCSAGPWYPRTMSPSSSPRPMRPRQIASAG